MAISAQYQPPTERMNISVELSQVSAYGGFFALTVGGNAARWHPVSQSYADGFQDLIEATIQRYRTTEVRVGASLVHLGHAARLWSPVLACALGHGVVPDLAHLQRADDGAQLRCPSPRRAPQGTTIPRIAVPGSRARPHGAARGRAAGASWRPACWPATSRLHSSERRGRCSRCGPTCASSIVGITKSLLDTRRAGRIRRDHRRRSGLPASQLLPVLSRSRRRQMR